MKKTKEITIPKNLRYAGGHEWLLPSLPFRVGITDYAQDRLGDVTFAELPETGRLFQAGEEFGSLESIKSISSLYLPVDGTVTAVNEELRDDPGLINRDPYGEGWIVEIQPSDPSQAGGLMDAAAYRLHIGEQE